MNKVLILDERVERKKNHMSNNAIRELTDCMNRGYLAMNTGEGIEKDNSFQYCSDYSLLAFHKSWLDSNKLFSDIVEYAKNNKKHLVIFSGGISQTLLLNDFKDLRVNSADFYTDRLPVFIEKYAKSEVEQPLLELLYGKSWLIPIFMQYRQMLWRGVSKENNEFEDFESNYKTILEKFKTSTSTEIMNKLEKSINIEIIKSNAL